MKNFGTTLNETINAFKPLHLGEKQEGGTNIDRLNAYGRIIITILLLIVGTYLFTNGSKEIGGTIFGAILGYWLK